MKKLFILSIICLSFCLFISLSVKNNDKKINLSEYFTEEEIIFINDNNIPFESIKPYLSYKSFDIYHFFDYEKKRLQSNNYLEALNLYNNSYFYTSYTNCEEVLFINTNYLLVNKHYGFSPDFVPKTLVSLKESNVKYIVRENETMMLCKEALDNYEKLYSAAFSNDIELVIYSAYRSYEKQYHLYYVVNNQNDNYSAKPGHSEHQSGLAIDISTLEHGLTTFFQESESFIWLTQNAHKYGFIQRYPADKESITNYLFEPWHFRYVGLSLASYLYNNNITLEEYIIQNYELH